MLLFHVEPLIHPRGPDGVVQVLILMSSTDISLNLNTKVLNLKHKKIQILYVAKTLLYSKIWTIKNKHKTRFHNYVCVCETER